MKESRVKSEQRERQVPAGGSEYAIEINNLTFTYPGGFTALKEINLKVKRNEFVGIIGQNGAGKSTLLKNITGLLKPTKGDVIVVGVNTKDSTVADLATRVGFVLQNPDRQLFAPTVEEEVSFGPKNLKLPADEIKQRVQEALGYVGLLEQKDAFPPALSKGDRAKVVIASVLAMRPEVIILDEPTTGQDFRGCHQIMGIASRFHEAGHTVLVVTHHMALVTEYTQRTIVLCNGTVLMDGETREVFSHPEMLRQTFIVPPQITQAGTDLKEALMAARRGWTPRTVLTVKELGEDIVAAMKP